MDSHLKVDIPAITVYPLKVDNFILQKQKLYSGLRSMAAMPFPGNRNLIMMCGM